ncbi:hypothetical protein F4824DRAFT_447748 [Ustulina deusta]|nr:hypothetical protein F4824DRAFT_447748 [Ustulina deusta]
MNCSFYLTSTFLSNLPVLTGATSQVISDCRTPLYVVGAVPFAASSSHEAGNLFRARSHPIFLPRHQPLFARSISETPRKRPRISTSCYHDQP